MNYPSTQASCTTKRGLSVTFNAVPAHAVINAQPASWKVNGLFATVMASTCYP